MKAKRLPQQGTVLEIIENLYLGYLVQDRLWVEEVY